MKRSRRRRGFFVADAMMGIAIMAMLATLLVVTIGGQAKANRRMAEAREHARRAEAALLRIQADQKPAPGEPANVRIRRLPDRSELAGSVWVEVSSSRQAVIGLVPESSLTAWEAP